jgi:hypothetical protein
MMAQEKHEDTGTHEDGTKKFLVRYCCGFDGYNSSSSSADSTTFCVFRSSAPVYAGLVCL